MSDANTKTFELKYPFEFKNQKFSTFTARRPKVRDLRKFVKTSNDDAILAIQEMLADLCETPREVMAEVDMVDFRAMREWFEDFFADTSDE